MNTSAQEDSNSASAKQHIAFFESSKNPVDFLHYHHHLKQVSRSFSFCIAQLPSPAKEWVALAYLLCRITDTIEDSKWLTPIEQLHAFQQLQLFLTEDPSQQDWIAWLQSLPTDIPNAEKILLSDLPSLLAEKKRLPPTIQCQLDLTLQRMIAGMTHFIRYHQHDTQLRLHSLTLTNQYCFFVAGIVGEWLTLVFTFLIPNFELNSILLQQAFHFGIFLQKINILKDQTNDHLAGRHFFSSRSELRQSLLINAQQTMMYIKQIPPNSGRPFRRFCAWSFFIGLASLKWSDKSSRLQHPYQLGSRETHHLLAQVDELIDDNYALEKLFIRYLPEAQPNLTLITKNQIDIKTSLPTWFHKIYPLDMTNIDISLLGIQSDESD